MSLTSTWSEVNMKWHVYVPQPYPFLDLSPTQTCSLDGMSTKSFRSSYASPRQGENHLAALVEDFQANGNVNFIRIAMCGNPLIVC